MTINFGQACNPNKTHFKCCLLRDLNAVLIQLIWICQPRVRFLVPVRFLHLPIRFRVYFFVARWLNLCQPPTQAALQCCISLQGPAGRTVITRYYKCNDSLILCILGIPPASLICKTGHPHDTTSHNHSHSLTRLNCLISAQTCNVQNCSKETQIIFYWHCSRMGCSLHQVPGYWDLCTVWSGSCHNIDYFVSWGEGEEGGSLYYNLLIRAVQGCIFRAILVGKFGDNVLNYSPLFWELISVEGCLIRCYNTDTIKLLRLAS